MAQRCLVGLDRRQPEVQHGEELLPLALHLERRRRRRQLQDEEGVFLERMHDASVAPWRRRGEVPTQSTAWIDPTVSTAERYFFFFFAGFKALMRFWASLAKGDLGYFWRSSS